jgi:hypothetical protein
MPTINDMPTHPPITPPTRPLEAPTAKPQIPWQRNHTRQKIAIQVRTQSWLRLGSLVLPPSHGSHTPNNSHTILWAVHGDATRPFARRDGVTPGTGRCRWWLGGGG